MLKTKTKIHIARAISSVLCGLRKSAGYPPNVEVERDGFRWSLDLREGIDLAIYLGVYERKTTSAIRRLVRPGAIALDIGANIGAHTLELARRVGSTGQVLAFEPTMWAVERLRQHIALNPEVGERITVEQAMLTAGSAGGAESAIYSRWPLYDAGVVHSSHFGKLESTEGSRAVALDDYLATTAKRVDFIKLDVDGFECEILDGARITLETLRPVILLELAPVPLLERGRSLEELLMQLERAGYELFRLSGAPLPATIARSIEPGSSWNAVARKRN